VRYCASVLLDVLFYYNLTHHQTALPINATRPLSKLLWSILLTDM